jgi:hypothetical protein
MLHRCRMSSGDRGKIVLIQAHHREVGRLLSHKLPIESSARHSSAKAPNKRRDSQDEARDAQSSSSARSPHHCGARLAERKGPQARGVSFRCGLRKALDMSA